MRTNPHILEVNTRAWLNRLAAKYGRPLTLSDIPDEFLDSAKAMGFDAIWLMGVWQESAAAREIARADEGVLAQVRAVCPQANAQDISASPYAVYDYVVDDVLGGNNALLALRERLHAKGMLLLLDFVGNHTALDCPAVTEHPEYFINTGTNVPNVHPEWFFQNKNGVYIAHGRDPYFSPWTDTAQLNYFNAQTRDFMLGNLRRVADLCDGVRCDMAMLSLNKVVRDTWWEFVGGELPKSEFWSHALAAVREDHPEFVFIAEVYWGLEWEIQEMGFDYTYDKVLYDRLRFSSPEAIKAHLGAEHLYQMRSMRFTSNHDEEEALSAFGRAKSLAAGTIISTLPGARLYHLFQLMGRPARVPIQYTHDTFPVDEEVFAFYRKLLAITSAPAFHGGEWFLCNVDACGNFSNCNMLAWQWKQMQTGKLVVINYSPSPAQGTLYLKGVKGEVTEEFSGRKMVLDNNILPLALNPYESQIFTYSF